MDGLTGFQRDVLYALAGRGECAGFAISDELDGYYPTEIRRDRLYPNLETLVEERLVEKRDGRTNRYALSRRGERELRERRAWEDELAGELFGRANGAAP